jgi:two-component system, OmpR family, response regulator
VSDQFDLDFTRADTRPEPSVASIAKVSEEASAGLPQLTRRGFYVAMARRGGRIEPRNGLRHLILVVEDDPPMQRLVGEVLANAGFLTRVAGTRHEINAEFNRPPLPDLVLLDVSLPDADGFAILERIRGNPRIATLPVVMLTAKSDVADVARGLALGADGYVTKPFEVPVLLTAVRSVLGAD